MHDIRVYFPFMFSKVGAELSESRRQLRINHQWEDEGGIGETRFGPTPTN